ncbi:MAG: ComEC/Rec2 family competence protein [Planctomycetota bacterium]|nr:ComEC/Rec2 family competence protein [Planctomycetota bacterium]
MLTPIFMAWCLGTAAGLQVGPGILVGGVVLVGITAVALTANHWSGRGIPLLLSGFILLAGLRSSILPEAGRSSDQVLQEIADGRIVTARGVVEGIEEDHAPRTGALEGYGYVPRTHRIIVSDVVVDEPGTDPRRTPALRVRVLCEAGSTSGLVIGDVIEVMGRLQSGREPRNPGDVGGRDLQPWLTVPHLGLVRVVGRMEPVGSESIDLLASWRGWVVESLRTSMGDAGDPDGRSLVCAMILGERGRDFERIMTPFRRTGTAHYLAVSGFAIGVMIGVPILPFPRRLRRIRSVTTIVVIGLAISVIDMRSPAWRAALMAIFGSIGAMSGREWGRMGMLSLSGLILLIISPRDILNPGFQLSYGVVAALIVLAPRIGQVLTSRGRHLPSGSAGVAAGWLTGAASCGIAAWIVATPMVWHHFGIISPLGSIISVLAAPLVAATIILAMISLSIELVFPWAPNPAGYVTAMMATLLHSGTGLVSSWPWCCFVVEAPGVVRTSILELLAWRSVLHRGRRERVAIVVAFIMVMVFPLGGSGNELDGGLEVHTLDVGNGTCHLVRGPDGWSMVDSGSASISSAFDRVLLPALRELGIGRIRCALITHPNLDHFSMIGDVLGRIPLDRIVVGSSFMEKARSNPGGAENRLTEKADRWGVAVDVIGRGDALVESGLRWDILHPGSEFTSGVENDHSLVVGLCRTIACESGRFDILFTGDIEERAMRALLDGGMPPRARVLEAPHHGSVRPSTRDFIRAIDPEVIVQSTGRRRLDRDAFAMECGIVRRMVTARHGAIHTSIARDGFVEVRSYVDDG